MSAPEYAPEKGLPANIYAERLVLGAILQRDAAYVAVAAVLAASDFVLDKHRRIFQRMGELHERPERIDHVTVANELMRFGELEACDGVSYLVSLADGLPELYNLESYVQIVKDRSMLRQMIFTSQEVIERCMAGEETPDEILSSTENRLLEISESRVKASLVSAHHVIENYEGGMNAFLDPGRRIKGISTGFLKLDEMTGGLHAGELFILAARPSMGKTALALNIAMHVAANRANPKAVAVFSLEMSKESLLTRVVCAGARVDQQKFRSGYLGRDERNRLSMASTEIFEAPLYIDDSSNSTLLEINAKLRKLRHTAELGLVVIDYLQLMPAPSLGKNSNRTQEVGALSRGLKLMSKDLEVPFLVLSQLSRAPEMRPKDHRPQLSDLRESGSIEQDADVVGFIYRPEVYNRDKTDLRGKAELILAKQRNGPTGTVHLVFLREYTKFENRTEEFDASEAGE